MAYISFTDDIGAATLDNGKGDPASRFANWMPMTRPVGEAQTRQSDGRRIMYRLRDDYGASFEFRFIPYAKVATADRLIYHLLNGGACVLYTDDSALRSYTAYLAPGTEPQFTMTDPKFREYTLSLSVINGAAARMECTY